MLFTCEKCGKKRDAIFKEKDVDIYVCWSCLSKNGRDWHGHMDSELNSYRRDQRLKEISRGNLENRGNPQGKPFIDLD